MAMTRNQPYDRAKPDPAQNLKETIARYRGAAAGVQYAEALWLAGLVFRKSFDLVVS